ncbi:UDP-glucose/GDP-mannose dehydrogenase family protein [Luteolibacter ambystomatis]|uniref:UDP-glucose 6-dehydrogenase n=1 Tax=Luteolibacter ambystomatis TaxID=2824561 RepID=A0A975G936_9BACT|nr:UDP-glucose/GDP-mannose dehydrogenase family protein [Luteolibacter ambystomatis]QUE51354.1 UDP-glucose/GDP-mannose dehydrogenase family protein [Luteolibacter ambystomatis]
MNLTIIGTGYVGLTTGTCFAEVGHHVTCVDNNPEKIETLLAGRIPIYEPGLEELVKKNVAAGRLKFTTSTADGVKSGDVVFIAVPTPPQPDGSVDLSFIEKVAREIAECLTPEIGYRVIVDKSTVPVKTGEKVAETVRRYAPQGVEFGVVSNPEFLREGCAVDDLLHPDRIVIGSNDDRALALMHKVYEPFVAPVLVTDINSAELIKHAANSFLALKISYINAVSAICEASGADVEKVAEGIGTDKRIGRQFLNAGLGYGGSCFPKDVKAFIAISESLGTPFGLLKEVERINGDQLERFLAKIREKLWVLREKKIALWGLAFKQNTDDVRESVAIRVAKKMIAEGATLIAWDPEAIETSKRFSGITEGIEYAPDMLSALDGADALVIATEWSHFANVDLTEIKKRLRTPLVFDGRNLLDPAAAAATGLEYHSVGRPAAGRH